MTKIASPFPQRLLPWLLLGLAALAAVLGLWVPVLDVDSAQYAHMSRQILQEGQWLQIREWDHDYLDKPPLLFWLGALSYMAFGVSAVAFKLPTLLLGALTVWSVWGIARRLYDKQTAWVAAWILACSQGCMLMLLDVKTDGVLTAFVALACWMLLAYVQDGRTWQFLLAFTAVALAMMAKGPMGLMAPALTLGSHWVLRREWRNVFRLEWLTGILWVLLLLLPMLYGLYAQWGWEGPRFFFWTQSFGRLTGENVWKDDSGYFYLLHIWLWVFLPLALLSFWQAGRDVITWVRQRFVLTAVQEGMSGGGFLLMFLGLSLSQYKLPHYLFVAMPMGALLAARAVIALHDRPALKAWRIGFTVLTTLEAFALLVLTALLLGYVFPGAAWGWWVVWALLVLAVAWTWWQAAKLLPVLGRLALPALLAVAGGNVLLNGYFYPHLLRYQSGTVAGDELARRHVPSAKVVQLGFGVHSFVFHAGHYGKIINTQNWTADLHELHEYHAANGWLWVYTHQEGYEQLITHFMPGKVIRFAHYDVQQLSPDFLDPHTRPRVLETRYLVFLPGKYDHLAHHPLRP
ncbi:MAG: glycosyltransferase family 39 protein [Bacteroidetes bacterium]|nr:glycosyltransferase family 39 protein [Bacteroidota bacterium]